MSKDRVFDILFSIVILRIQMKPFAYLVRCVSETLQSNRFLVNNINPLVLNGIELHQLMMISESRSESLNHICKRVKLKS